MAISQGSTQTAIIDQATGQKAGVDVDRLKVTSSTSVSAYLNNNQMFSAAWDVSAANSGSDNPLLLLRNPLGSGKNLYIVKIFAGSPISNVSVQFSTYANPVFTNTVANISTINQPGLNTTVTVTTATNHNATIGATVTIAGTVNFNGAWTVLNVTSPTVFTFTRTPAPLITLNETVGTTSVPSSLGTARTPVPRFVGNSPTPVALVNTNPTVSSNGSALSALNCGQNSNSLEFDDEFSLAIAPNNSILITGDPLSNNRNTNLTIIWAEVSI